MPQERALGANAQLLGAFESPYGTAPDGTAGGVYRQLSFKETDLGEEQPLGVDQDLGQGRDAQDPFYDAVTNQGNITVGLDDQSSGFWFKGLMGDPVTTGAGPYDHVFTSGADLPSLALELGFPNMVSPYFARNTGVKLGGFSIDMSRSGQARMVISYIAQGETYPASAVDASPTVFAGVNFNNARGSILVGGQVLGNITGGSVNFSNNLDPVETIREDGLIGGVDELEATCSGTAEARFANEAVLEDPILNQTPVVFRYRFTIPGAAAHHLTIDLPRVFLPRPKKPISGPGGVSVTYNWQASKDNVAGHMMQVSLRNGVDAY